MAGPASVELSADCTTCGLEAGVSELYDALVPACRFGLPAAARCKLCGIAHEGAFDRATARAMIEVPANRCPSCLEELGPRALDDRRCAACGAKASLALVAPAAALSSEPALSAALDAWAAREHWSSRQALLEAVFCDPDLGSLLLRIQRGEPLEVVADPFANMGIRTARTPRDKPGKSDDARGRPGPTPTLRTMPAVVVPPAAAAPRPPAPPPAEAASAFASDPSITMTSARDRLSGVVPLSPVGIYEAHPPSVSEAEPVPSPRPPQSAPPRAIVYPLVSVIAADGEIHPAERALIDRFLESEGLAPLAEHEFRVHHPSAVAHLVPKQRRDMVVQLMCETATVDGMPDESERRVIRAYAAEWGVADEKVEFWMWGYESMSTSLVRQLWMKLRRFVLSARWSDAGQENR